MERDLAGIRLIRLPLTERVTIRFPPDDIELMNKVAPLLSMSVTQFLRYAAKKAMVEIIKESR